MTIRCPRDIRREDFTGMLAAAPKGAVLLKSKRTGWIRTFMFRLEKRGATVGKWQVKRGDNIEFSLACKFK